MAAGLSREQVSERLAVHFSAKFGGTVWATYDPSRRAYEIRGERLPAAPEMRETYPNGWSLLAHMTPTEARAVAVQGDDREDYVLAAEKAGAEMCGLVVTVAIQNDAFAEDTYGECARILRELADQLDRAEDFTYWRTVLDANGNSAGRARIA